MSVQQSANTEKLLVLLIEAEESVTSAHLATAAQLCGYAIAALMDPCQWHHMHACAYNRCAPAMPIARTPVKWALRFGIAC